MKNRDVELIQHASQVLRSIGHPVRLKLIETLRHGKKSVGELTAELKLEQAVVSKHLAVLKRQAIFLSETDGNYRYYSIANPGVLEVLACLKKHCKKGDQS